VKDTASAKAVEVAKTVAEGVVVGLLYYVVYVLILPKVLTGAFEGLNMVFPISMGTYLVALYLFVGLGTATSLLKNQPLSLPLKLLSKVFGALLVLAILNFGKLQGTIPVMGMLVDFRIDISVLLYAILLFSMLMFP